MPQRPPLAEGLRVTGQRLAAAGEDAQDLIPLGLAEVDPAPKTPSHVSLRD